LNGARRIASVLLASAVGIAILCGLGIWQVRRLAWKEGLIAALEARMAAAPVPLADALKRLQAGEDVEYLKVTATGTLDTAHVLYKQIPFKGLPGWEALAPFHSSDGQTVLVDLGGSFDRNQPAQPVTQLTGVLRLHGFGRGIFDSDNDATGNMWFWWDVPAMEKAAAMPADAPHVVVQALGNDSGFEAAEPKVELRNNHLGYAITWFGLALALAGVTLAFVLKKPDP
jgi:surfeit locus 1 family protein